MASTDRDAHMQDADAIEEEQRQYGHGPLTEAELDKLYPNRPHNHARTLPFHELVEALFKPLSDNRKRPARIVARKKQGPHGPKYLSPNEARQAIIERFVSRWRRDVGTDFYPAFRLILPDKDRDRAMYGLKEKTIGKLLVKVMKIDRNSEDGHNLLNWRLPGQTTASRMAGDFAGRCHEVISKRPMRTTAGDMTIADINDYLDRLAAAQKEENQLPIFEVFYKRMSPDELLWLIRIILRQMKVGATEKTFFDLWHPDAEILFSVSSSLRRVCWELYDPSIRLHSEDRGIALMQCFQPQLAQFQMHSIEKMIAKFRPAEGDSSFWVEEKVDGERMQLHMMDDDGIAGGKRFAFWSRRAKEYTHLYGEGFEDESSALTRHIKDAFHEGVRNIILDGEMITWDPEQDAMVPFGTLKSAAISEARNPYANGERPLFRVFDLLYLNDKPITEYTLRDRRSALEASVTSVHRRMEIHPYEEAHTAGEVETLLRKTIAEASEGLVLKNPRSMYRLNERNDDWLKLKPEYMTEFGESLDCLIIGGYYGSGNRGGGLSSFLCGLRVDQEQIDQGANPMKFYSFFKVGGGFTAGDYAAIRHQTDDKWKDWDAKRPPTEFIELAGGIAQAERPDRWIRPDESVVVSVKAASAVVADTYRTGVTLRFPRFKAIRAEKNWRSALSLQEFLDLRKTAEQEHADRELKVDDWRKRRRVKPRLKKELTAAGDDPVVRNPYGGPESSLFEGLNFFIMTESLTPERKCKVDLEQMVKANGGKIFQSHSAASPMICMADRRTVKVASLQKLGTENIIRPSWLFHCIKQHEIDAGESTFLLPLEPEHMFFTTKKSKDEIGENVDRYGDSYARDVSVEELKQILNNVSVKHSASFDATKFKRSLLEEAAQTKVPCGWLFFDVVVHVDGVKSSQDLVSLAKDYTHHQHGDIEMRRFFAAHVLRFGGAETVNDLDDSRLTHVVVVSDPGKSTEARNRVRHIREQLKWREKQPRIVTLEWVERSWAERTLLDEERFAPT